MSRLSWLDSETLWLFLLVLCVYCLTLSGHLYTVDGVLAFQTAESLALRGSLELPESGFLTLDNTRGKPVSRYPWGQSILLIPFYWLGLIGSMVFGNRETWCLASMTFSSALIGALLVLATRYLAQSLGADKRGALWAGLALGIGSIFWVYSQDLFRNPLAALLLAASVAALFRVPEKPNIVHLSGAMMLLLIQVRMDGVLAIPILFAWLVFTKRRYGVSQRLPVVWLLWCVAGCALLGLNNWIRFGNPLRHNIPNAFFTESLLVSLPGFLWSLDKSMFLYSPTLLLIFWSIPRCMRANKDKTLVILGLSLLYLIWYGKYHHWFGGRCWGPRYTLLFTPLLLATIGPWLSQNGTREKRWFAASVLGLGALVQATGVLIEQNVHVGFHHSKEILADVASGKLDPWWARTWDTHPTATIVGCAILLLVFTIGIQRLLRAVRYN